MKKTAILLTLALVLLTLAIVQSRATVTCTPSGSNTAVLGLCNPADGETGWGTGIRGNFTALDGLFTGASLLKPLNGGTGVDGSAASNGKLLIGNGTGYTLATVTGTANQVTVTNGAGSITLSTPQSIATTSSPQFTSIGLGAAASGTSGDLSALRLRAATGGTPTCTVNCGTGSSVAGSDGFFVITGPTTPLSVSTIGVTFSGTWATAPACIATEQSGYNNGSAYVAYAGTSTVSVVVKLGQTLKANEQVAVVCAGIS